VEGGEQKVDSSRLFNHSYFFKVWGPTDEDKNSCIQFLNLLKGRQDGAAFTPPSLHGL
jgi:hypothetical protein